MSPPLFSLRVCISRGFKTKCDVCHVLREEFFMLDVTHSQVCTFHDGCKQGIDQQIFNWKSISRKITHPQSRKLQAKLTGEKLKG